MASETYAKAGVDVKRAEEFVKRLKSQSQRQGHETLWEAAGGYAAVYPVSASRAVAVTTDGVGTKLLVANELNKFDTIGIDLVAMCANDLICVGAQPTIFLDYFAIGKLEDNVADEVIAGIVKGCDQAGMLLAGGETAEMPGLYAPGHFDLAGFALGLVSKSKLIVGTDIKPGHKLIGVASSGIHSNGLSLARKVLAEDKASWHDLLVPTLIYVEPVNEILGRRPEAIKGMSHITGGGWRNLFRLNDTVGFHFENVLPVPDILKKIAQTVPEDEMYKTFNMGMGLGVITDDSHQQLVLDCFREAGFLAQVVGVVTDKPGVITISGSQIVIKEEK